MAEKRVIPERLERTPAVEAAERMFLNRAKKALEEARSGALEFLAGNPGVSIIGMAERLNRGASAMGLIMAIYEEAMREGVVRDTAKDLLVRLIRDEFPQGWSSKENIRPNIRLWSWDHDINNYVQDRAIVTYAGNIIKDIAIDDLPPEGWKPRLENDPLIEDLFDRHWPVRTPQGQT